MTWNSENRMTESVSQNIYSGAKTLTRYKYDHEGNRVVKSINYGEVVTPTPEISYRNDSIVTKHIFVSGVRVASKVCDEKSSNTYYQSVDHLGSTNILTDAKGEFYEHVETFPDGTVWVKEFVNQSGVNTVFTSHEMDVETKFFYCKARYYDAQLGRFISVDPIIGSYLPSGDKKRDATMPGYGGFYNPVNINMYSYGANNPMTFVDPTGEHNEFYASFNDCFQGGKRNHLQRRVLVSTYASGGKTYIKHDPCGSNGLGWSNTQGTSESNINVSVLIRVEGKLYLMTINKTDTVAPDNADPNRVMHFTLKPVSDDGEVDMNNKNWKSGSVQFTDSRKIKAAMGRATDLNIITGYEETGNKKGRSNEDTPEFVKGWSWTENKNYTGNEFPERNFRIQKDTNDGGKYYDTLKK